MKRVSTPEILDTDSCSPRDVALSLRDISRMNRWFGGVSTAVELIKRVSQASGRRHFSLLEVAAGSGEVTQVVAQKLKTERIILEITLLDRAATHLPAGSPAVAADGLALPFADSVFDLVGCNLFAHHLEPEQLVLYVKEAMRVSRCAVLIDDLVRHPIHVACVCAGFVLMRTHVSRLDGLASVRRAYLPQEVQQIISSGFDKADVPRIEVFRRPLFRMGVTIWKTKP